MSIENITSAASAALVERDDEVRAIVLALVAREHVLLVGPPGTAKSMACRAVAATIDGARYCERLLAPTTPPEAVWGPISLAALREDRYEHVTAGSVADAHIAFLDEVGRASPAIADTLLHVLGPERQALIGTRQVRVPLVAAIGAANTWPIEPEQAAFLDRWLIRREVRPLSRTGRARLLREALPAVTPVATLADLEAAQRAAEAIVVDEAAYVALDDILEQLAAACVRPSDRRLRAAVKIARAAAVIDGAASVTPAHLEALRDVLWDRPTPEAIAATDEIVTRVANPTGAQVAAILLAADDAATSAANGADVATKIAATKKLQASERELAALAAQGGNGRAAKALAHVRAQRITIQAALLGIDPSKAAELAS
jgi:MoxR-like ATPase